MKRIILIVIPVLIWLSASGYLLLSSYSNNEAPTATSPFTIENNNSQMTPVAPGYISPAHSPPTYSPPAIQNRSQTDPLAPRYTPPAYSPPTSISSDYSPAWNYSNSDVDVRGYYRKDGTYVKPYSRTKPDGIKSNNYGYPGNYNPNTGKISK